MKSSSVALLSLLTVLASLPAAHAASLWKPAPKRTLDHDMNNIRNQRMLPKHKAGQKNAFNKVGYPSPKYAFEDWAWAIEGVIQLPRNVYYAYNVPSVGFEHRLYVNGRDGEGTADAIERFAAAHAGTEFRLVDISVDGRQVVGTTILLVEIGERALPSRPRATGAVQVDRLRLGDKTAELDQQ